MSPDHPEPAPPLEREDLALEDTLRALRPRPVPPVLLTRLIDHLELAAADDAALTDSNSIPMPLDSSLLAFESELRALRPLDLDFPTGQQVLRALEREMTPAASPAAPAFRVLDGPPAASRRKWTAAMPWAAAAALVAVGWMVRPLSPRETESGVAGSQDQGLIPYASSPGKKGTVSPVFPVTARPEIFGAPQYQVIGAETSAVADRSVIIPQATSPYGFLGVSAIELPEDYCQKIGIRHGVGLGWLAPAGPAMTHGLDVGDIILRINGAPVSSSDELTVMIKNSTPGSPMVMTILRGRMQFEVRVRLGSAPSA